MPRRHRHTTGSSFLARTTKDWLIGTRSGANYLYAANFATGKIDVFDGTWQTVNFGSKAFNDAMIPKGYAPFNVQNLGGKLYVTYAKQDADKHDDVPGQGHGFVDVFDTSGHLLKRLVTHGQLDSPWGLAIAPPSFGKFANALLVGNFGDGHINAFNAKTGNFIGALQNAKGHTLAIDGLWALSRLATARREARTPSISPRAPTENRTDSSGDSRWIPSGNRPILDSLSRIRAAVRGGTAGTNRRLTIRSPPNRTPPGRLAVPQSCPISICANTLGNYRRHADRVFPRNRPAGPQARAGRANRMT